MMCPEPSNAQGYMAQQPHMLLPIMQAGKRGAWACHEMGGGIPTVI